MCHPRAVHTLKVQLLDKHMLTQNLVPPVLSPKSQVPHYWVPGPLGTRVIGSTFHNCCCFQALISTNLINHPLPRPQHARSILPQSNFLPTVVYLELYGQTLSLNTSQALAHEVPERSAAIRLYKYSSVFANILDPILGWVSMQHYILPVAFGDTKGILLASPTRGDCFAKLPA